MGEHLEMTSESQKIIYEEVGLPKPGKHNGGGEQKQGREGSWQLRPKEERVQPRQNVEGLGGAFSSQPE